METLRDQVITATVRTRLGEDQDTCGQTIDVSVADGDLFLIGWCDSDNQRVSAVLIRTDLVTNPLTDGSFVIIQGVCRKEATGELSLLPLSDAAVTIAH